MAEGMEFHGSGPTHFVYKYLNEAAEFLDDGAVYSFEIRLKKQGEDR